MLLAIWLDYLKISDMHTTQNPAGANADGHASKPGVKQMHNIALLGTFFWDDGGLGARVYESLNGMPIHRCFDVKHSDSPKEFWAVF